MKNKPERNYRNPIYVAKKYKQMIETGQARNEADLARQIGVSRVTVNHYITLLKLAPQVIRMLEELGNPMPKRYISARKLRSLIKIPSEKQKAILEFIIP
ncbi:MAG: hypothetical protein JXQ30_16515 [Spirochaetes bacterium]|nr:hypothetical protein [Spirochaetota bacterium]